MDIWLGILEIYVLNCPWKGNQIDKPRNISVYFASKFEGLGIIIPWTSREIQEIILHSHRKLPNPWKTKCHYSKSQIFNFRTTNLNQNSSIFILKLPKEINSSKSLHVTCLNFTHHNHEASDFRLFKKKKNRQMLICFHQTTTKNLFYLFFIR